MEEDSEIGTKKAKMFTPSPEHGWAEHRCPKQGQERGLGVGCSLTSLWGIRGDQGQEGSPRVPEGSSPRAQLQHLPLKSQSGREADLGPALREPFARGLWCLPGRPKQPGSRSGFHSRKAGSSSKLIQGAVCEGGCLLDALLLLGVGVPQLLPLLAADTA